MMCTMKRCVALLGLFVLGSVVTASAQVTYQITTVPTFVILTGRSEVVGSVRITVTGAGGTTVASTIEYLFQGVPCDNDFTSGVSLSFAPGGHFSGANVAAGGVTPVANTAAGCVVSITVAGGVTATPATDWVQLDGVRARIDLATAVAGTSLLVSLNSTPSTTSLFNPPTTAVVATAEPGLAVNVTSGTQLLCLTDESANADIQIQEGFNASFVQYATSAAGHAVPPDHRPIFGAINNTQVQIVVYGLPVGVTLSFPTVVCSNELGCWGGVGPGGGSQLEVIGTHAFSGGGPNTSFAVTYDYACHSQAVCDVNTESFDVIPDITALAATTLPGSATANATLYPPLITGGSPLSSGADAVLVTDIPFGPGFPRPRFKTQLIHTPPDTFLVVAPCTTNLLFPWVVSNVAGFDTGIAIANTSVDPFTPFVVNPTPAEHGTCTIWGFPKGEGTPISLPTMDISAGDTYTKVLSTTVFNGFAGYIIARCNFQYGHGFAFLTNNFGTGMPPTVGQGYVALIIPDPAIQTKEFPSRGAAPDTWSAFGQNTNTGEELSQ